VLPAIVERDSRGGDEIAHRRVTRTSPGDAMAGPVEHEHHVPWPDTVAW